MWKNNDRIIDFSTYFLICSMARYNGRLHCIVGVLPTCYKRKAATYFLPPGWHGAIEGRLWGVIVLLHCLSIYFACLSSYIMRNGTNNRFRNLQLYEQRHLQDCLIFKGKFII